MAIRMFSAQGNFKYHANPNKLYFMMPTDDSGNEGCIKDL